MTFIECSGRIEHAQHQAAKCGEEKYQEGGQGREEKTDDCPFAETSANRVGQAGGQGCEAEKAEVELS